MGAGEKEKVEGSLEATNAWRKLEIEVLNTAKHRQSKVKRQEKYGRVKEEVGAYDTEYHRDPTGSTGETEIKIQIKNTFSFVALTPV